MGKALIVIDYTNDFVADQGALTCGAPGQAIEDRIVSLVEEFLREDNEVVMAVDMHTENDEYHPETKLFPPHNIIGTNGRDLYGKLHDVYQSNKSAIYWMDKTRYSAFAGTDLEIRLRSKGITELHLVGVCTDICVLHTAVDAYNKGFSIVIHEDGVQSFSEVGHQWALQHFKNAIGATIVRK
ncbi:cysteine hydrolase family protein [Brevibacillus daliensis]|uniref:cysteine hydrolase family protein n=1 Tax=Brevibacillus daliensis TaxID=2892995 RepID=UPI001E34155E|nr:isochorismatase family cysteine hydrolase [Brevibacillus daliensis]